MTKIAELAQEFEQRLSDAKRAIGTSQFEWYPYHTLSNLEHLQRLLPGRVDDALAAAPGAHVADIGSGDGDLSFFMESLGCEVDAIDSPIANHNGMKGIRALKQHLGSKIEIHTIDLDTQFQLPRERYDLAVFLGVLYHLKNPFYAMERLSMQARYCLMSTRVARCYPNGQRIPNEYPVAYLLDAGELNQDDTNFWIFSPSGLERLLRRARWDVIERLYLGDTKQSRPTGLEHDERVFYLLKSRYGLANVQLLDGWYEPTDTAGWRWTKRCFSAQAVLGDRRKPKIMKLHFYVPPEALERTGPLRLSATLNGKPHGAMEIDKGGELNWAMRVKLEREDRAVVAFELNKALVLDNNDERELGLVVGALEFE